MVLSKAQPESSWKQRGYDPSRVSGNGLVESEPETPQKSLDACQCPVHHVEWLLISDLERRT